MKSAIVRSRLQPIACGDFDYAACHDNCANDLEYRISERNLDLQDENVAVEMILHRTLYGVG